MFDEIPLTDAQRENLLQRCRWAAEQAQKNADAAKPETFVRQKVLGLRGLVIFAYGFGLLSGFISLAIWTWLFGFLGITDALLNVGLPGWIVGNLPVALSIFTGIGAALTGILSESLEARYHLLTEQQNAHVRADVLYSVVRELSNALPGAVPDLFDYAHDGYDSSPNPLVERALGRWKEPAPRPQVRQEPPVSR